MPLKGLDGSEGYRDEKDRLATEMRRTGSLEELTNLAWETDRQL